ncbi:MAG: class B sortase [Lachnospiraceae bacterium]|nr:class B sortase [Lachnospiraceae bacterium]MBQ9122064.1 class B sortase [Lachnospiraceae bacterium]
MEQWQVRGRSFRTQGDYLAAKRDEDRIKQIEEAYQVNTLDGLKTLYKDLKERKIRFLTIIGQDYLEEVEDKLKKKLLSAESNNASSKKKKSGGKTSSKSKTKMVRLEDYDKEMQQIIKSELKKRERKRKILVAVSICTALACFGYFGYYYYNAKENEAYYENLASLKEQEPTKEVTPPTVTINYDDEEIVVPDILDEYKNLFNKNEDLIGWIKIADNNKKSTAFIDYPVVQADDNDYYLRRDFEGEYDKNGSIFLDKDCDVIKRSTNLIIYGHHMRTGKMFGKLDKYSDKDFYEDHKYIEFDTIYEKGVYEVMYVFRSKIYEEDDIVFKYYQFIDVNSEAEFESNMREMAEMSLYDTGVTAKYGDQLLTLSTCDYYTDYGRFVVVAKRIQ